VPETCLACAVKSPWPMHSFFSAGKEVRPFLTVSELDGGYVGTKNEITGSIAVGADQSATATDMSCREKAQYSSYIG